MNTTYHMVDVVPRRGITSQQRHGESRKKLLPLLRWRDKKKKSRRSTRTVSTNVRTQKNKQPDARGFLTAKKNLTAENVAIMIFFLFDDGSIARDSVALTASRGRIVPFTPIPFGQPKGHARTARLRSDQSMASRYHKILGQLSPGPSFCEKQIISFTTKRVSLHTHPTGFQTLVSCNGVGQPQPWHDNYCSKCSSLHTEHRNLRPIGRVPPNPAMLRSTLESSALPPVKTHKPQFALRQK